ncbi:DNA-3-methyladenine glycosidase [Lelliottia amnigena]|nr:DNA-3-methyladenine glycosidase [Lelliottia amnigena]
MLRSRQLEYESKAAHRKTVYAEEQMKRSSDVYPELETTL